MAIYLQGNADSFAALSVLAEALVSATEGLWRKGMPLVVVTRRDVAKALGHAIQSRLHQKTGIVCLDGLQIPEGSYLDIAQPVGQGAALPVVIKTLAFETDYGRDRS